MLETVPRPVLIGILLLAVIAGSWLVLSRMRKNAGPEPPSNEQPLPRVMAVDIRVA
jgi:hypothetical protein